MMTYAYDPYLPEGRTWRDLFDMVIVQVRALFTFQGLAHSTG